MDNLKQKDFKDKNPVALVMGTGICALGTIRSLKEDPAIPIILMGNKERGIAQYSKYISDFFPCNEADIDEINAVLSAVNKKYEAVIPFAAGADFWISRLLEARETLDHFILDVRTEYAELMKKNIQRELAQKCGIPYPQSLEIHSAGDMGMTLKSLRFPVVVKPVSRAAGAVPFRIRAYKAPEKLQRDLQAFLGKARFLASTEITGPDKNIYTYGSFAVNGVVKNEFFGRKLTQRPMKYGVAGIAESAGEIPEIREYSRKLLKETAFTGISQIEFKYDRTDKKYYLMEINPRIWLWIQAATGAGVNLPLAAYDYHAGRGELQHRQGSKKVMFVNGLSMFDNTFRERKLIWLPYYIKSLFVKRVCGVKDFADPMPYRIECRRFLKKIIHKIENND